MKYLFLIFFSFLLNPSFSQKDKVKILANFDYIEYYSDSTIKEARKFSGNLDGTTIEFNASGEPVAIGNYKKGIKTGKWLYSDGSYDFFPEQKEKLIPQILLTENYDPEGNKTGSVRPGCGTGISLGIRDFYQKYLSLVNPKNLTRQSCWGQ